jgi:hypothetical protein
VTVEALESGVAGLLIAHPKTSERWVLVHAASGLAVSRMAKHHDPEVLVGLAGRLATLADWTQAAISVPGPVLRREVDRALSASGLAASSRDGDVGQTQVAESDRNLLVRVLRSVHTAVAPAVFAKAIGDLDTEERARLRALLTDEAAESGMILKPLPGGEHGSSPAALSPPVPHAAAGSAAG